MADLRDFTGKNRRFTGTDSVTMPTGTTGERVNGSAKIRFNSTLNLMEYYDGANWKSIDSPPSVTGFTIDDIGGFELISNKRFIKPSIHWINAVRNSSLKEYHNARTSSIPPVRGADFLYRKIQL